MHLLSHTSAARCPTTCLGTSAHTHHVEDQPHLHRVRPGPRTFAGKRESGAGTKYVDAPFKGAGSPRRPTMNPFDADQLRASSAMSSSCESVRRAAIVLFATLSLERDAGL